jgi:hypothetical protein
MGAPYPDRLAGAEDPLEPGAGYTPRAERGDQPCRSSFSESASRHSTPTQHGSSFDRARRDQALR